MTGEVAFIKEAVNAKATSLFSDTHDFADTLDPQFLAALIRGRKQDFNPNIRSNWRAFATEDEDPIQRNVVGEASLCVLSAIVPMEDDREAELVSNSDSTLQTGLTRKKEMHT